MNFSLCDGEWRLKLSNNTKIQYLQVMDKIYKISGISFFYMTIDAVETDVPAADIPGDELWNIQDFKNYRIKLINNGGQAEIINFEEWKSKNRSKFCQ